MHRVPTVELSLSLDEAESLHALLGWRILAARGGTGLTGRIAVLAREADTLEEYEEARDLELGPVLDGLESAENRDP